MQDQPRLKPSAHQNYHVPQNQPIQNNILWCVRLILTTDMFEKRVGGENGMTQQKDRLEYFSDSELDSESDEGENYQYKHKYETLI